MEWALSQNRSLVALGEWWAHIQRRCKKNVMWAWRGWGRVWAGGVEHELPPRLPLTYTQQAAEVCDWGFGEVWKSPVLLWQQIVSSLLDLVREQESREHEGLWGRKSGRVGGKYTAAEIFPDFSIPCSATPGCLTTLYFSGELFPFFLPSSGGVGPGAAGLREWTDLPPYKGGRGAVGTAARRRRPNHRREVERTHSPFQEDEPPQPWICKKSYSLNNFSPLDITSCPKGRLSDLQRPLVDQQLRFTKWASIWMEQCAKRQSMSYG